MKQLKAYLKRLEASSVCRMYMIFMFTFCKSWKLNALFVYFLLQNSGGFPKPSLRSNAFVTMVFLGKNVHLSHDDADYRDEIKVFQQHCGGENLCVYKGMLLEGGKDKESKSSYWFWQHYFLLAKMSKWYQNDFSWTQSRYVHSGIFIPPVSPLNLDLLFHDWQRGYNFANYGRMNLENWFNKMV